MAFVANLTIDKLTFRVFSFDYSAYRDVDRFGRPTSVVYGVRMKIVIEHKADCVLLHEWAYKNYEVKSGTVTFMKRDAEYQKDIEFKFNNAYISQISLIFSNHDTNPMSENLDIVANNIEIESEGKSAMYLGDWAEHT